MQNFASVSAGRNSDNREKEVRLDSCVVLLKVGHHFVQLPVLLVANFGARQVGESKAQMSGVDFTGVVKHQISPRLLLTPTRQPVTPH